MVVDTSINHGERVLGGGIGEVEVIEVRRVLIGWQRSGQQGVRCVAPEKAVHVLRSYCICLTGRFGHIRREFRLGRKGLCQVSIATGSGRSGIEPSWAGEGLPRVRQQSRLQAFLCRPSERNHRVFLQKLLSRSDSSSLSSDGTDGREKKLLSDSGGWMTKRITKSGNWVVCIISAHFLVDLSMGFVCGRPCRSMHEAVEEETRVDRMSCGCNTRRRLAAGHSPRLPSKPPSCWSRDSSVSSSSQLL